MLRQTSRLPGKGEEGGVEERAGLLTETLLHQMTPAVDREAEAPSVKTLQQVEDPGWIACDQCDFWYHLSCIRVTRSAEEMQEEE